MPVLDRWKFQTPLGQSLATLAERFSVLHKGVLTYRCGSPSCTTRRFSGVPWNVHSKSAAHWAAKDGPRFEGLPVCSRDCLEVMVATALRHEMAGGQQASEPYRHRIPLGLFLLSRHSITREQLTAALESQRNAGHGRLGEWLIRTQGVDEEVVASALAAQRGMPVLPPVQDVRVARLLPRIFVELFGVVPMHLAAGRILYLAVDDQVDRGLHGAIERMTGYKVEPGVMKPSAYQALRRAALADTSPTARLFAPGSVAALEVGIADLVADRGAASGCIARIREYIWLRIETMVVAKETQEAKTRAEDWIFTLPQAGQ